MVNRSEFGVFHIRFGGNAYMKWKDDYNSFIGL